MKINYNFIHLLYPLSQKLGKSPKSPFDGINMKVDRPPGLRIVVGGSVRGSTASSWAVWLLPPPRAIRGLLSGLKCLVVKWGNIVPNVII
jgi:hypothetical protein